MWSKAVFLNKEFWSNNLFLKFFWTNIFWSKRNFAKRCEKIKKNRPKNVLGKEKILGQNIFIQKMLCKKIV